MADLNPAEGFYLCYWRPKGSELFMLDSILRQFSDVTKIWQADDDVRVQRVSWIGFRDVENLGKPTAYESQLRGKRVL